MYKSDSILAHTRTPVANLTQRGQATLPGHLIFISVFRIFNRLAKASGFCLYFFPHTSSWRGNAPTGSIRFLSNVILANARIHTVCFNVGMKSMVSPSEDDSE